MDLRAWSVYQINLKLLNLALAQATRHVGVAQLGDGQDVCDPAAVDCLLVRGIGEIAEVETRDDEGRAVRLEVTSTGEVLEFIDGPSSGFGHMQSYGLARLVETNPTRRFGVWSRIRWCCGRGRGTTVILIERGRHPKRTLDRSELKVELSYTR